MCDDLRWKPVGLAADFQCLHRNPLRQINAPVTSRPLTCRHRRKTLAVIPRFLMGCRGTAKLIAPANFATRPPNRNDAAVLIGLIPPLRVRRRADAPSQRPISASQGHSNERPLLFINDYNVLDKFSSRQSGENALIGYTAPCSCPPPYLVFSDRNVHDSVVRRTQNEL